MKQGRSLQELAAELERQVATRKDFIAPQGEVETKVVDGEIVLDGLPDEMPLTNLAHAQFGDELGIPRKYYDRMKTDQPELLSRNINTWLHDNGAAKRMFRTLDGKVRAFLSPKYRPLDNFDLAQVVLPALIQANADVKSAELTETQMYIKAILPDLSDELPEGLAWGVGNHIFEDRQKLRVVSAITIANSEVGMGTLRIEPGVFAALCTNLATLKEAAMKKYHVGRSFEADSNFEVFRDETRQADDKAFFLKVRDVTLAAFDKDRFAEAVAMIRRAGDHKIESSDLPKVVEVAVNRLALPQSTQNNVLSWLAKGGQLNQWGLSSAITRAAQDADSYEVATELERAGGEALALPEADFDKIGRAA